MPRDIEPLLAALADDAGGEKLFDARDHVDVLNAERFAGAQNGGAVVRVVRSVQDHRHGGQAAFEHVEQASPSCIGHQGFEGVDQALVGPTQPPGAGMARVRLWRERVFTISAHGNWFRGQGAIRPDVRQRTSTTTAHRAVRFCHP